MSYTPQNFRKGFQLIYLAICVYFVGTVAVAATWGAFAGDHVQSDVKAGDGDTATSANNAQQPCRSALRERNDEVRQRVVIGIRDADSTTALQSWRNWSINWRNRLQKLRKRCHKTKDLGLTPKRTFRDVERLHRAYDTALTGFVELGRKPLGRLRPVLMTNETQ